MRTKTLLFAAAALAAGVTASKAQTVYSQNVVGYINQTITNNTLALLANQLDTGSNTINNVYTGAGLASSQTILLEWNGAGYNQYLYYNSSDALNNGGTSPGWYDLSGNPFGQTNYIQPEYGYFLKNTRTGAGSITVPTVGQVVQGTNVYSFPKNSLAAYSLPEPLAGLPLDNTNINFPALSSQTIYETWNGAGFNQYLYYNSSDAINNGGTAPGWYDLNGNDVDGKASVWPGAGQAFFIKNTSTTKGITWTNVFQVQ
jgi:hypothetical protein